MFSSAKNYDTRLRERYPNKDGSTFRDTGDKAVQYPYYDSEAAYSASFVL